MALTLSLVRETGDPRYAAAAAAIAALTHGQATASAVDGLQPSR